MSSRLILSFICRLAILLCLVATAPSWAQPAGSGPMPAAPVATDWNAALAAVTRQLRDPRMDDEGFAVLRADLDRRLNWMRSARRRPRASRVRRRA
jgi:hypothetical protein